MNTRASQHRSGEREHPWRPGGRRSHAWSRLTGEEPPGGGPWDLLVIGGGVTGAGILREAARQGFRAALIEQRDFAWGTSSRSSKMVHGGLRYLMEGRVKLTRDSVRERERLLRECPGLVKPLGFVFSDFRGEPPSRWSFQALLAVYDLLAGQWHHRYYPLDEFMMLAPRIRQEGLKGGAQCWDAVTDDARLVLRLIQEAEADGALAVNYAAAESLMTRDGRVCGVAVEDRVTGSRAEVPAGVVVNATGVWADRLRKEAGGAGRIRPLRGSHLVFPFWRVPVAQAQGLKHPVDRRSVFLMPWEGVTLVGSTDLDHARSLDEEPFITPEEVAYLMEVVHHLYPSLGISEQDIWGTYSGVRSVIGTGLLSPSKERRDHHIWVDRGLISAGGGKLTTFRLIARDVLREAARTNPSLSPAGPGPPPAAPPAAAEGRVMDLDAAARSRLLGRYGDRAAELVNCAREGELDRVPGTGTLWAELRWAARSEAVVHLEDLLLRRVRLGILAEAGGMGFQDVIGAICREELGWDEERWDRESRAYQDLWRRCHGVPGRKAAGGETPL